MSRGGGPPLFFFFFLSRELSFDKRSNRIGSRHIGDFLIFSWNVRTSSLLRPLPRSHLSFDRVLGCRTPCFKFYISLRMYTALCNWVCAPPLYTWTLSTVPHKTPFEGVLGPKVRRELSLDTLKHAWRHGFQGRLMLCLCQPYVTLEPSKAEVYPPQGMCGVMVYRAPIGPNCHTCHVSHVYRSYIKYGPHSLRCRGGSLEKPYAWLYWLREFGHQLGKVA